MARLPPKVTIGNGLTEAATLPGRLVQPPTEAITEYTPVATICALVIEGFCKEEVKVFGPVQEKVAPGIADANKFNVEPRHIDPPFVAVAVGVGGKALTVAVVVATALVQPLTVTVTE